MIKKKLGKILFAWDSNAMKGKGYWYVAGKNDTFTRAATKEEASKLGKPKASDMPPNDVEKPSNFPARKAYYTTDKQGRPVRKYTKTGSSFEEADITRSKSLSQLATEKLLSGASLGGSIKGAITDKTKAIAKNASKFIDPMHYLSKIPGVGQLAAGYYGKKKGRSAEDIAHYTGVIGSENLDTEEMDDSVTEEQSTEKAKVEKVNQEELVDAIKKTYKWGDESKEKEEKEKKEESGLFGMLGSLVSPLMRMLPMLGGVAAGVAGLSALNFGLGKLGVGKDKEGKDLVIDNKKDDANWDKMNTFEKIQSGAGRGIEKVGNVISPNASRQAESERITKESEWLKDREKDNANWDKMNTFEKIQSGAGRGIEQVGGLIVPETAKKAKESRVTSETEWLKSREQDNANWDKMNMFQKIESGVGRGIEQVGGLIAPETAKKAKESRVKSESAYFNKGTTPTTENKQLQTSASGELSGVTTEQITSHPNFKKYYEEELQFNPSDKNAAYEAASMRIKDDMVAGVQSTPTSKTASPVSEVAKPKTIMGSEFLGSLFSSDKPKSATAVKTTTTDKSLPGVSGTLSGVSTEQITSNPNFKKYYDEALKLNPNDKEAAYQEAAMQIKNEMVKVQQISTPNKISARMNDSVKENVSLTGEQKTTQAPVVVNAPSTKVINNQGSSGGGSPTKIRNDEAILTRLQYQTMRPV